METTAKSKTVETRRAYKRKAKHPAATATEDGAEG